MSKRRSEKSRTPATADAIAAGEIVEDPRLRRSRRLRAALTPALAMLSAAALNLSFAPFDLWWLAYAALVPLTMAATLSDRRWWSLLWVWLGGVVYWAAGIYWMSWVDLVGYCASVGYLSLYWLVAGVVLRAALRRNWPAFLVLPAVWVALEYVRSLVIGGFPWFFLSQSQYEQIPLIQICDLFGEFGLSFLVAMANGALVDLLRFRLVRRTDAGLRLSWTPILALVAVAACAGGALLYGTFRLGERTTRPGPVIGLVQQAFPISLAGPTVSAEKILADHLAASEALVGAGCDVVLWPETMLPKGINPELLTADAAAMSGNEARSLAKQLHGPDAWNPAYSDDFIRAMLQLGILGRDIHGNTSRYAPLLAQAQQLADLSRRLNCPILAGAPTVHRTQSPLDDRDLWCSKNSALLFDRQPLAVAQYSKLHLVPFGEYVPFKSSWLGLHKLLRSFVPDVMDQLSPGEELTIFTIRSGRHAASSPATTGPRQPATAASAPAGETFRLAVPICYEGVFARLCRDMVMADGQKRVDLLANLSNDGWFVHKFKGSTEQSQHLAQYVFRAIETRTPVVRAVNTGISASIDSDGRIAAQIPVMSSGTLLLDGKGDAGEQYAENHGPRVLVDSRITLYSRIGDVFAQVLCAVAILLAVGLWAGSRKKKKGSAT